MIFMVALGVITLFLTGFVLVYYAYIANHTEHDVSFFLSVGIISMVMNLCTNAGGAFGLAWLYLVIAVAFIGVGFAVSVPETVGFYASIGPWFKKTFTNTKLIGWQILSAAVFPTGIALYFAWHKSKPELAKKCGQCGAWGLVLWGVLLWMNLGLVL